MKGCLASVEAGCRLGPGCGGAVGWDAWNGIAVGVADLQRMPGLGLSMRELLAVAGRSADHGRIVRRLIGCVLGRAVLRCRERMRYRHLAEPAGSLVIFDAGEAPP